MPHKQENCHVRQIISDIPSLTSGRLTPQIDNYIWGTFEHLVTPQMNLKIILQKSYRNFGSHLEAKVEPSVNFIE